MTHTAGLQQTLDWTQVLVVGIPLLLGQIATVVIAVLNNRKATDAATKVAAANTRVQETAAKVDEVHRQTKPSNGITLTATVERMAKDVSEVRREQTALATLFGEHLGEHDNEHRRRP